MKNKHQQILSEMNDILTALKDQIAALEIKISEYQQIVENQSFGEDVSPIVELPEEIVEDIVEEDIIEDPEVEDPGVEDIEVEEVEESDETPEVVVEMLDIEEEPEEEQYTSIPLTEKDLKPFLEAFGDMKFELDDS